MQHDAHVLAYYVWQTYALVAGEPLGRECAAIWDRSAADLYEQ